MPYDSLIVYLNARHDNVVIWSDVLVTVFLVNVRVVVVDVVSDVLVCIVSLEAILSARLVVIVSWCCVDCTSLVTMSCSVVVIVVL